MLLQTLFTQCSRNVFIIKYYGCPLQRFRPREIFVDKWLPMCFGVEQAFTRQPHVGLLIFCTNAISQIYFVNPAVMSTSLTFNTLHSQHPTRL